MANALGLACFRGPKGALRAVCFYRRPSVLPASDKIRYRCYETM
jgi:hypothetical protein